VKEMEGDASVASVIALFNIPIVFILFSILLVLKLDGVIFWEWGVVFIPFW
jgi:hypothetical protein